MQMSGNACAKGKLNDSFICLCVCVCVGNQGNCLGRPISFYVRRLQLRPNLFASRLTGKLLFNGQKRISYWITGDAMLTDTFFWLLYFFTFTLSRDCGIKQRIIVIISGMLHDL